MTDKIRSHYGNQHRTSNFRLKVFKHKCYTLGFLLIRNAHTCVGLGHVTFVILTTTIVSLNGFWYDMFSPTKSFDCHILFLLLLFIFNVLFLVLFFLLLGYMDRDDTITSSRTL